MEERSRRDCPNCFRLPISRWEEFKQAEINWIQTEQLDMMPLIADLLTKDLRNVISSIEFDDPNEVGRLLEALFIASIEAEEISAREVNTVTVQFISLKNALFQCVF